MWDSGNWCLNVHAENDQLCWCIGTPILANTKLVASFPSCQKSVPWGQTLKLDGQDASCCKFHTGESNQCGKTKAINTQFLMVNTHPLLVKLSGRFMTLGIPHFTQKVDRGNPTLLKWDPFGDSLRKPVERGKPRVQVLQGCSELHVQLVTTWIQCPSSTCH